MFVFLYLLWLFQKAIFLIEWWKEKVSSDQIQWNKLYFRLLLLLEDMLTKETAQIVRLGSQKLQSYLMFDSKLFSLKPCWIISLNIIWPSFNCLSRGCSMLRTHLWFSIMSRKRRPEILVCVWGFLTSNYLWVCKKRICI